MRFTHWKQVAVSAAVVASSIGAGAAWASQNEDPVPAITTEVSGDRLIGTGVNDVKFVPVTPCRLVDTRVPGQRFSPNQVRIFDVRGDGASFAAQGGKAGGCGIPGSVTAVEVTVSAVGASGNGFLRVYPDAVPTASFLSFNGTSASSNTGTVSICGHKGSICLVNSDLRVKAFGSGTDVVIDISGYYARPMAGTFKADQSVVQSSRITGITKLAVGSYKVDFDRDVSKCVPLATPLNTGFTVSVSRWAVGNNAMYVAAKDLDNNLHDAGFNIEVVC